MISIVITVHGYENADKTIQCLKEITNDIVILHIRDDGYSISDYNTNSIYAASEAYEEYSCLMNMCMEYVPNEYVFFINAGEYLEESFVSFGNKGMKDAYYVNVLRAAFEGEILCKEIRLVRKNVHFTGKYKPIACFDTIDELDILIKGFSREEKKYFMRCIDSEGYMDNADLRTYAECCYALGQYSESSSSYRRLYARCEGIPDRMLYRDMCWAFIAEDACEEARSLSDEGINANPCFGELYYIKAAACIEIGDLDSSIDALNKLLSMQYVRSEKELKDYRAFFCYKLLGRVLYEAEEYKKAIDNCSICLKYSPYDQEVMKILFYCLVESGLCRTEIDDYFHTELDWMEINQNMLLSNLYESIRKWDEAISYAKQVSCEDEYRLRAHRLYYRRKYKECFSFVMELPFELSQELLIISMNCLLLDGEISRKDRDVFIVHMKNNGYTELMHVYEFICGSRNSCDTRLLMELCRLLLETGDSRCIRFIRRALDINSDMDCMELIEGAFNGGLYYFCEEIINLYYPDGRYEYRTLKILAYICYFTGRICDSERYISYCLIIKESKDMVKLLCMCKLVECREIVCSHNSFKNVCSLKKLLEDVDEYEKIFFINGTR